MANAASDAPVIDVRSLSFSYGSRKVLDSLSIQMPSGAVFGVLGANGSGKTTLIRLLVGLLKPLSGTVRVLGEPPSPSVSRRFGYMPQLNALYLELSVQHNVDFFSRMYGMRNPAFRHDAVENILKLVGLWDRRKDPILALSGGMRQRVSLAIAMVHSPPLLLLDEPTVGLDPELRATFWEHFHTLAASGASILLSSHTMDDAAHEIGRAHV